MVSSVVPHHQSTALIRSNSLDSLMALMVTKTTASLVDTRKYDVIWGLV